LNSYGIVLFYSTNAAFQLEKTLKKSGIEVKLIPTPRSLSSDCGTALRFPWENAELVRTTIDAAGLEVTEVCQLSTSNF